MDWKKCAVARCAGAALDDESDCLAHLEPDALGRHLARFGRGRGLDGRGATIDAELLGRVLAAAPTDVGGRRRLVGVRFDRAVFESDVIVDGVVFGREASFDQARFRGRLSLTGATFEGPCRFAGTRFDDDASFEGAVFTSQAWFRGAVFSGVVSFATASFGAASWFGGASVAGDARFDGARFAGHAGFDEVDFGDRCDFTGAVFDGDAEFRAATFARSPVFAEATFQGRQGIPAVAARQQTQWSGQPLASWSRRAEASLIDVAVPAMIIAAGAGVAKFSLLLQEGAAGAVAVAVGVVGALAWMLRNLSRQGESGQTLGKRLVGLRLVGRYDQRRPVGAARSIARQVLHVVDTAPAMLGWLWPLVDANGQTFADKIAGTVVVGDARRRDDDAPVDSCC